MLLGCVSFSSLAFAIGPADTLRNELGEIIEVPPPGKPGVDFVKNEFIASLKPGFLILPEGENEALLEKCEVDEELLNLLYDENVYYVQQVFVGATPDDTIRIVEGETIIVPDLSQ